MRAAWLLAAALVCGGPVQGQTLRAADAMPLLADGRPWTGTRPDGEVVRITFQPDGTGRFEGPITRSITWTVRGEETCLHLGFPMGTKCVRFRRNGARFEAFEGAEPTFTLSR